MQCFSSSREFLTSPYEWKILEWDDKLQTLFTHLEKLPLPVKGCRCLPIIANHSHCAVLFLFTVPLLLWRGTSIFKVISEDPWPYYTRLAKRGTFTTWFDGVSRHTEPCTAVVVKRSLPRKVLEIFSLSPLTLLRFVKKDGHSSEETIKKLRLPVCKYDLY